MRGVIRLAAALALVACSGCVTPRAVTPPAPDERAEASQLPELRLPPGSLGRSLSLSQRLQFSHAQDPGAPRSLEALLEIDAEVLQLAGFAMHHRVFTLRWDGVELTEQRAPQVPAQLVAAHVLRDIQLSFWPADLVRAALPRGWSLEDTQGLRVLFEAGAERVRIRYDGDPRWSGRTTLENPSDHYVLVIDSTPGGE